MIQNIEGGLPEVVPVSPKVEQGAQQEVARQFEVLNRILKLKTEPDAWTPITSVITETPWWEVYYGDNSDNPSFAATTIEGSYVGGLIHWLGAPLRGFARPQFYVLGESPSFDKTLSALEYNRGLFVPETRFKNKRQFELLSSLGASGLALARARL